ncbi:hypothetical protein [Rhodococcus opacus]|uniref:hypothetical protein n=1 Tax=Rhodococcus opacus TaxID=37919 RepID=UPI001F5A8FC1|nr:hypothetical protein [Rhodococcus opacus]UNN05218.1 hypothetical protein MOO23_40070 [Rhodococcus opacus]
MANPYESRSGMRNTYGKDGSKTRTYQSGPTYSNTRHTKTDIYSGGTKYGGTNGKHGHKVKAGRMTTYSRKSGQNQKGMGLGDILFGPAPKRNGRPWWK